MKTDHLIALLAADTAPRDTPESAVMRWFLPALALAGGAALAVLGIRADILPAMAAPVTAMKPLLPLLVAVAAGLLALRLARPGRDAGWLAWPLVAVGAGVALWLAASMAGMPAAEWWPAARGRTLGFCLVAIPTIALLPLSALIAALRRGAPVNPTQSGALAGLAAGAASAALYALHCTEDSPLFFLIWYPLGIAAVAATGALAGRYWLRW